MNVIIKSPLMQDRIKALLDGGTFGGVSFSFAEKRGMEMVFRASGDNAGEADLVAVAKSAIKASDFGKGIMFSVALGKDN